MDSQTASVPGTVKGSLDLEALLRRGDVWRGHSRRFVPCQTIDSGHPLLNTALVQQGWPQACLIEIGQCESVATWHLFAHSARLLAGLGDDPAWESGSGLIVLLNPPATPFAVALQQSGLPPERVLAVSPSDKADFVACFVELARSQACSMLLSWQPKQKLSYAELRKCQLATHEQAGLYVLFRHRHALAQSSPAALRIHVSPQRDALHLLIQKQKGNLRRAELCLELPDNWNIQPDLVAGTAGSVAQHIAAMGQVRVAVPGRRKNEA